MLGGIPESFRGPIQPSVASKPNAQALRVDLIGDLGSPMPDELCLSVRMVQYNEYKYQIEPL